LSFPKFLIGNPKAFTEEEGKIHRGFPLPLFRFLIKTLRNDRLGNDRGIQGIQHHPSFPKSFIGNPKAFTEGGFFSLSGLLFFYVFCFFGGYEGAVPPYSTFPSFPKFFIGNPKALNTVDP